MLTLMILSQAEGLDWSCQRIMPRWHWSSMGRCALVGWPSAFWAQTCSFANWKYATLYWGLHKATATVPGGEESGPCSDFALYTLAFALQLRKNHGKTCQGIRKALSWPAPNAMASTGLLVPAALGFSVRRRGQPSVRVSICLVAELGASPHQLILSQSSQSGLWCGRQEVEHPDPRESTCH